MSYLQSHCVPATVLAFLDLLSAGHAYQEAFGGLQADFAVPQVACMVHTVCPQLCLQAFSPAGNAYQEAFEGLQAGFELLTISKIHCKRCRKRISSNVSWKGHR